VYGNINGDRGYEFKSKKTHELLKLGSNELRKAATREYLLTNEDLKDA
jgi:hypothetical protein